jgi:UrcA family protein
MYGRISSLLLSGCAAASAVAVGLSFAPAASAQTYDQQPAPYSEQQPNSDQQPTPDQQPTSDQQPTADQQPGSDQQPAPYADQQAPNAASDYASDDAATVGTIVVTPNYRSDPDENGIPTERVYASRVVDFSDLDLTTPWGVHELHNRVASAASDACSQLDNQYPMGLAPIDSNDGNCKARAVARAMDQAPVNYPLNSDYDAASGQ